ncbi:uncharacterized protein Rsod [Cloeon dipterum]|uniref:uncharacterized protein Rsod n=1 Tax=Cloeon dipterum TaxID=197152 RepID=UPI00321F87D7
MRWLTLMVLGLCTLAEGVQIWVPLSQGRIRGEIRMNQAHAGAEVSVRVALLLTDGGSAQALDWQVREFPVDYRVVDGGERCSNNRLGKTLIDLGERLGKLSLPENSTAEFIIPEGYLNLSKNDGIWGRSLVMRGDSDLACATLLVEGEERIAEAHFRGALTGSLLFRWFGADDGIDAIILSKVQRVRGNDTAAVVKNHNWKIFVTDSVESEADKSRDDCDSLQIVFDPDDRGPGQRAGDMDSRLGQLRTGRTQLLRDVALPELHESADNSARSLYVVVYDWHHSDSILACARLRRLHTKRALAVVQGGGLRVTLRLEQRSPYDLTYITAEDKNKPGEWDVQVRELPAQGGSPEACYYSGPLYDPTGVGQGRNSGGGSHSEYAVGSIWLKHGPLERLQGTWDSFLPLSGPYSVIHRSIYITYTDSVACATINPVKSMSTAQVIFRYPVVGRIILRQERDSPWADTSVLVEYLVYADGSRNDTGSIRWRVMENPAGKDFYNWTARCLSAGRVFDPNGCADENQGGACAIGGVGDRHAPLSASGGKEKMIERTRRLFTDLTLPLTGHDSVVGKALVLSDAFGPKARGERLACSTITWLPRVKAVVFDWFGSDGEEPPVKGRIEMTQQTPYDLTNVEVTLKGLEKVKGYHVHVAPVEMQLAFPCDDSTLYGHWNPQKIDPKSSPPAAQGTPEQYEMGDLSGKWGTFEGLTHASLVYNDSLLDLSGPRSVLGRSVVIHKEADNARWACATVERGYAASEARELRAIASFHHPGGFAYGYIKFSQLVHGEGSYSDTVIEVKLRHPGVNDRNLTRGHDWAIFVNPVGQDAAVKTLNTRCVAGGYVWNPFFIQLADPFNDELYREQCGTDNPLRCYAGDIGRRVGPINLGDRRQVFSDMNLPLEGKHSALGKSVVIFTQNGGRERYACANIEPDHDIIKYANIRRPPRFEVSKFLSRVRAILGIPDWMLNVDNRKTRHLHGNTCIQLLLHFRGPQASRLEQDFSRLLRVGSQKEQSLFIPGAYPDPKRPTSLSYSQCGVVDTNKAKSSIFSISGAIPRVATPFYVFTSAAIALSRMLL